MGVLNVTPTRSPTAASTPTPSAPWPAGLSLFEAGRGHRGRRRRVHAARAAARWTRGRRSAAWSPSSEALRDRGAGPLSIDTTKAARGPGRPRRRRGHRERRERLLLRPGPGRPWWPSGGSPRSSCTCAATSRPCTASRAYDDVMGEVVAELQAAMERGRGRGSGPGPGHRSIPASGSPRTRPTAWPSSAACRSWPPSTGPCWSGPRGRASSARCSTCPRGSGCMGTAAAVAACVLGGAHMVRVHDVREMVQVVRRAATPSGEERRPR